MIFETIHNFYEKLVLEAIQNFALYANELNDIDFLEDVACCALNNLPAKYVRYDVDLMFYMTAKEKELIESATQNAVIKAISYVRQHQRSEKESAERKTSKRVAANKKRGAAG